MTTYTFSNVDDPDGNSVAFGINDLGQIVGHYSDSSGATHGFLYSGGTYTPVDNLMATFTVAYGINDAGYIIGQDISSKGNLESFVYSSSGFLFADVKYLTYNLGNTTDTTELYGISNAGLVGEIKDASNTSHGFLFTGSTLVMISDPFGFNGTFANGINDAGQIVGYYADFNNADHGFLYSGGAYTTLNDPLGTNGTLRMASTTRARSSGPTLTAAASRTASSIAAAPTPRSTIRWARGHRCVWHQRRGPDRRAIH